jgi:hypothetical protein
MKVERGSIIAGRPIREIRDFLRWLGPASLVRAGIVKRLGADLTDDLVAEGLIEADDDPHAASYMATDEGVRLAAANFKRRISRAKADAIMASFLERVKEVNRDRDLISRVAAVHAFGSYITDAPEIGDLDLCVELERKYPGKEWTERSKRRAELSGRNLSYPEALFYGDLEVLRLLKGRSPYLSFGPLSIVEDNGWPFKCVYQRNPDEPVEVQQRAEADS